MTAPRETGAEGRIEELEQMVFAMMATDSLGNVIPADASEANRRLTAYRDALLATPRPVEVTEEMVEAAVEAELATYPPKHARSLRESASVMRQARDFYRKVLTAALRAQPAGPSDLEVVTAFREWWLSEVPPGTTIGNPEWWVPKILRALRFAERAQPAGGTPNDVCACGHRRDQHIYHEGACRPGFACQRGCEMFTPLTAAPHPDGQGERP